MNHTHFKSRREFILAGRIVEYIVGRNSSVPLIARRLNVTKSFIYYCLHIYYLPLPYNTNTETFNPEIEN